MPTMEMPTIGKTVIVTDSASRTDKAMHWKVVLHNCNCHSFLDVENALVKIIKCSKEKAKEFAHKIHNEGKAVVFSGHKERAEAKYFHLKEEKLEVELTQ